MTQTKRERIRKMYKDGVPWKKMVEIAGSTTSVASAVADLTGHRKHGRPSTHVAEPPKPVEHHGLPKPIENAIKELVVLLREALPDTACMALNCDSGEVVFHRRVTETFEIVEKRAAQG